MLKHSTNYRITWISCNSHLLLWNAASHHQWCYNRNSVQWNWRCHSTINVRSPRPVEDKKNRPPPWCMLTTANGCQIVDDGAGITVSIQCGDYFVIFALSVDHRWWELCICSVKVNDISRAWHKRSKSFGSVVNCVNSILMGIPLLCYMSHHGESPKEILMSKLMIVRV